MKTEFRFQGPFLHEAGGKFANGIITKTYSKGEVRYLFSYTYFWFMPCYVALPTLNGYDVNENEKQIAENRCCG